MLFARNLDTASSSDEGVYLASLDALRHGERLGSEVFASQPPAFYLVLRVVGLFAGHSLEAARIGFLLVALVGCAGAYALGRALGGIAAGLAAAGLIAILPPFASEAMRVDADVPAVSITLVALALVAWATHRNAPRSLAALGGAVLVFAMGSIPPDRPRRHRRPEGARVGQRGAARAAPAPVASDQGIVAFAAQRRIPGSSSTRRTCGSPRGR